MTSATALLSDLDELETSPAPRTGPRCSIEAMLTELRDAEGEATATRVLALIDNKAVPATTLADKLKKNGLTATAWTVRRHRNRGTGSGCACAR